MQCLPGQRGGGGFFGTDGKGEMMNYRLSMRGGFVAVGFSLLLMQGTFPLSVARGNELVDLRDISVGMSVKDLSDVSYTNFSCVVDPTQKLSGWESWKLCPAAADGTHAVRFDYDRTTSREGTIVAGHPVILTLLVDDQASVAGLQIDTDSKARLYIRKKAFLLGMQAKSRYGLEGWDCTGAQPNAQEEPVGGVYVNERCTKAMTGRSVVVERRLFRRPDQDVKTFVDETRIIIMRAKS
jgi:hypothetical protein